MKLQQERKSGGVGNNDWPANLLSRWITEKKDVTNDSRYEKTMKAFFILFVSLSLSEVCSFRMMEYRTNARLPIFQRCANESFQIACLLELILKHYYRFCLYLNLTYFLNPDINNIMKAIVLVSKMYFQRSEQFKSKRSLY